MANWQWPSSIIDEAFVPSRRCKFWLLHCISRLTQNWCLYIRPLLEQFVVPEVTPFVANDIEDHLAHLVAIILPGSKRWLDDCRVWLLRLGQYSEGSLGLCDSRCCGPFRLRNASLPTKAFRLAAVGMQVCPADGRQRWSGDLRIGLCGWGCERRGSCEDHQHCRASRRCASPVIQVADPILC